MTLSAKWTAVSFFALTALAAGSFAFAAGCTVTSGTPSGIEAGPPIPGADSGTAETSTGDSAAPAKCEGNKQASGDFVSAQCQAFLNANCCAELKGCFNIVVDKDAGGPTSDCDTYVKCVDFAKKQATQADREAAQKECDLATPTDVQNAYDAIVKCASDTDGGLAVCQ